MNPVVQSLATQLAILDEITDTGNWLDAAEVVLFQNDVSPTKDTLLADLTLADFSGYAASAAVVWGAAFLAPGNIPTVAGDMKQFVGANPLTVTNVVFGWGLTNAGGTVLLIARKFDTPVTITVPLQAVNVLPTVPAFLPQ